MAVRKKMRPETSMVNIAPKRVVRRTAVAEGSILLGDESIESILRGGPKGDVLTIAEVAGIGAAKRTSELIPLCHQIPLNSVSIKFKTEKGRVNCICTVEADWKTGVEMEALTGVAVSLLTVWDMVKRTEKDQAGQYPVTEIRDIRVVKKKKVDNVGGA